MNEFQVKTSFSILLFWIMTFMISCSPKQTDLARKLVGNMTLDQKIGQMIMVGVPGNSISVDSRELIRKNYPGGIILFGYNLAPGEKAAEFIKALQEESMAASGIPLFISLDQEGGRVKRLTDEVTQFPGNMAMGVVDDEDLVFDAARILGIQLRQHGINMNLAPVLDVNNNPDNPVINTRSFGSDPSIVAAMGVSYIKGLQKSDCIAVGKHFPGHGDTNKDSHLTLPVIPFGIERLRKVELYPFREAIAAGVECIMTAHIAYPAVLGDTVPATLSPKILSGLLRKEMKFNGVIITDDLEMDAISKMMDIGDAAVATVKAGSDIVLISSSGQSVMKIMRALKKAAAEGEIPEERINESVCRILELKLRYNIMRYSEGKIVPRHMEYSRKDMKLLGKADAVNSKISGNAIYFYRGDSATGIFPIQPDTIRVLFSTNVRLKEEIEKNGKGSITLVNSERELLSFISRKHKKPVIVFYHSDWMTDGHLDFIRRLSSDKDICLVVVSSDNPFPLAKLNPLPPTLFTFSNTDESLRQAARCINGELSPRKEINFYMGLH